MRRAGTGAARKGLLRTAVLACACGLGLISAAAGVVGPATAVGGGTAPPSGAIAPNTATPPARAAAPSGTAPGARGARAAPAVATKVAAAPPPVPVPDPGLRIPVLMYHVIARPGTDAPLQGLYVDPSLFAAQMRALSAAGYQAVTLGQAYAIWQGKAAAPAHPVVVSFDDGYVSVYQNALPVLRSMAWPAVLCQQVQRIDFPGGFTAAQIHTMLAAGWELADHAVSQPEVDLTTASPAVVHWEVYSSRSALQARFDVPVRFFCYPVGHYDPAAEAAVRAAGFVGAIGTVFGPADPAVEGMYRLERIRVWAGETPSQLVAIVDDAARQIPPAPPLSYPEPAAPAPPGSSAAGTAKTPTGSSTAARQARAPTPPADGSSTAAVPGTAASAAKPGPTPLAQPARTSAAR